MSSAAERCTYVCMCPPERTVVDLCSVSGNDLAIHISLTSHLGAMCIYLKIEIKFFFLTVLSMLLYCFSLAGGCRDYCV